MADDDKKMCTNLLSFFVPNLPMRSSENTNWYGEIFVFPENYFYFLNLEFCI